MALGATRSSIGRLIVSQGIRLTLLGEGAGVLASAALGRVLKSLLYGVRSLDVETALITIALLGIAATTAARIPAYRSHPRAAGEGLTHRIVVKSPARKRPASRARNNKRPCLPRVAVVRSARPSKASRQPREIS